MFQLKFSAFELPKHKESTNRMEKKCRLTTHTQYFTRRKKTINLLSN